MKVLRKSEAVLFFSMQLIIEINPMRLKTYIRVLTGLIRPRSKRVGMSERESGAYADCLPKHMESGPEFQTEPDKLIIKL